MDRRGGNKPHTPRMVPGPGGETQAIGAPLFPRHPHLKGQYKNQYEVKI